METAAQLLSLKVMRVSRPALATAWEPFYSSSSSFSARSTASIMSLQGQDPLPGHPKTLRDLTHISELLTLPSAFGAIQLGETFSSCLSVNNEASMDVSGVTLSVEMQTATTKTVLAELGGSDFVLKTGDTLENVVHHEIKELGQHVLACTVSYHIPPGANLVPNTQAGQESNVMTFRKFYKFSVTNPLSVKTKVHVPRSPSALVSSTEREKVFLEVHIQNLTPDAMWLQRMDFESTGDWHVHDANVLEMNDAEKRKSIFSGSMALMHPQDVRQYIYILTPKTIPAFPVAHAPGSIIPLGRLDISWRSSFGEPGRLLTSMLTRRIPLIQSPQPHITTQAPTPPPKQQPASALPLHLQRSNTAGSSTPPRTQSPQLSQRPLSPPASTSGPAPYRPGSPFRARTNTIGSIAAGPQSPVLATSPKAALPRPNEDVEVDLVVRQISPEDLTVEKPFTIAFTATVSAPVPPTLAGAPRKQRVLSLVVQHVQPPRPAPLPATAVPPTHPSNDSWVLRQTQSQSGFSTPSAFPSPPRADFPDNLTQRLLVASPRQNISDRESDAGSDAEARESAQMTPAPAPLGARDDASLVNLPSPFALAGTVADGNGKQHQTGDVVFLGPSALFLPQIRLSVPSRESSGGDAQEVKHERNWSESTASEADVQPPGASTHVIGSVEFELEYLALQARFLGVGGIRIVVVEDRVVDEEEEVGRKFGEARILKEWDVVGELWMKTI